MASVAIELMEVQADQPLAPDGYERLVDAHGLLEALFDEQCRPSLRWLRQMQARRMVPYKKGGHRVFFDVHEVRQALDKKLTVRVRD